MGAMEGPGLAAGDDFGFGVWATKAVPFLRALGGSKVPSKAPVHVAQLGFTWLISCGIER